MTEETAPPVVDRMAAARAARAAKKAAEHPVAAPQAAAPEVVSADEAAEPLAPTTMEKAALTQDAKRAAKVASLRAAKLKAADPSAEPTVTVRITKKGHGQISMGEHVSGLGDLTYDHNETAEFPRSLALELEDRGFAEIQ